VSEARNTRRWAERTYGKYGERAVAMAVVCREQGLRDLVVPVADIPSCIPKLAEKSRSMAQCMEGGFGARRCSHPPVVCLIADSGFVGFFCEPHGEKRVVRLG